MNIGDGILVGFFLGAGIVLATVIIIGLTY